MVDFRELVEWFEENKRLFPWREERTPYRVLVAEMMLQQTQAERVIIFFDRWMKRFPTLGKLAAAPLQEVLKEWEGLGYYSRARALHAAARYFVEEWGGIIPQDANILKNLKGFGEYTTAAVLSFGFQKFAAPCDANVFRVMSRVLEVEEDISLQKTQKKIREELLKLLPKENSAPAAEALIELGATLCTKRAPKCTECPLSSCCRAFRNGKEGQLPKKGKKLVYQKLLRDVAIIFHHDELLLQKGSPGKVMADLYEFPYFSASQESAVQALGDFIKKELKLNVEAKKALPPVFQSFTRFRVVNFPKIFEAKEKKEIANFLWIKKQEAKKLAFSSAARKIIESLNL
jgi:A/G-specific adenine glycosylase